MWHVFARKTSTPTEAQSRAHIWRSENAVLSVTYDATRSAHVCCGKDCRFFEICKNTRLFEIRPASITMVFTEPIYFRYWQSTVSSMASTNSWTQQLIPILSRSRQCAWISLLSFIWPNQNSICKHTVRLVVFLPDIGRSEMIFFLFSFLTSRKIQLFGWWFGCKRNW